MRVIAGTAKGYKLLAPQGEAVRPTADRVKEAIFSMIAQEITGAGFLDLYSGTGAMGIESLSRGCGLCVFMEKEEEHYRMILDNLSHVQKALAHDHYKVYCKDAGNLASFTELKQTKGGFDLIFMDPPYGNNLVLRTLDHIGVSGILNSGGLVIAEQHRQAPPPEHENFVLTKAKNYGKTSVYFLKRAED